jgi:YbgC/YbaW family acyl-CoA thioester hydrolase
VSELAALQTLEAGPATVGTTRLTVRFHELDPNGHVNHGVYANYFETARIESLDRLGIGPAHLAQRGVHLVVVELRLRFRRPALAGDELTVTTAIRELRRSWSWWHQQLLRGGELLAEADVRSAATTANGRPTAPPADVLAALRRAVALPTA